MDRAEVAALRHSGHECTLETRIDDKPAIELPVAVNILVFAVHHFGPEHIVHIPNVGELAAAGLYGSYADQCRQARQQKTFVAFVQVVY